MRIESLALIRFTVSSAPNFITIQTQKIGQTRIGLPAER